ncbi:MAG TPA: MlaD family protein [bacterium]
MPETKFGTNAKVGIFVFITMFILLWMTFQLERWGKVAGYPLIAAFKTAQGVNKETGVFLAGIKVGEVGKIELSDGMAKLQLKVYPQYKVEHDAVAIIRQKGLLGEKYVEIKPGTLGGPYLKSGESILRTESPPDYEELITDIGFVADNLKNISDRILAIIERNDKKVDVAIQNIVDVTGAFNRDLPDALRSLRVSLESMGDLMAANKEEFRDTIERFGNASEKLEDSMVSVSKIVEKIENGEGTIGKLINDDETVDRLNEAITGIQEYITTTKKLRFFVSYRGEYEIGRMLESPGTEEYTKIQGIGLKSFLDLKLYPKEDKYYMLGAVNDPERVTTVKDVYTVTDAGVIQEVRTHEETVRDSLKFNAEIAKRIGPVTFRGGIIESSGGLGMDLHFLKDAGALSVEAFDFSRDTNPYLKSLLSMRFLKYFFVSGGVNDFINYQRGPMYFFGGGLSFEDEDLKSIIGIAGTAAYTGAK